MVKKLIFFILIVIGVAFIANRLYFTENAVTVYEGLDVSQEPVQTECTMEDFTKFTDQYNFKFTGKADYKMVGKVRSIQYYANGDWSTLLSNYDFVMVWGKLADREMDRYFKFEHKGRVCNITYRESCPLSFAYINDHCTNNHLIHANEEVLQGLKQVRIGDIIYLEGYLVHVSVIDGRGQSFWETSLERTDADCEIIYVKKVVIGEDVYERAYW